MARWLSLVAALWLVAGAAAADQRDARLPALFDLLKAAESPQAAQQLEAQIWRIWSTSRSATAELLLAHGTEAEQEADLRAAEESYTAAINAVPDFAEAWNRRATVRFAAGNLDASLADVERVLALEPRHFGALAGLGRIHERQDRPDLAVDAYRRALELHPQQPALTQALTRARTQAQRRGT